VAGWAILVISVLIDFLDRRNDILHARNSQGLNARGLMSAVPRGRRPAGSGTREAILDAARSQFGRTGYEHTTLRSVATEAGVDARLVSHYFGSKRELFMASVQLPVDPQEVLARVFVPGETSIGHAAAETLLAVLDDPDTRQMAIGLIRAAASEPEAAQLIREVLTERVLLPLAQRVSGDQPRLRASLVASQFVGIAMGRYIVQIEPLASATREQLVRALGPVYGHYLAGAWTDEAPPSPDDQPARRSPS
jgi:AcrR family transcriptional regulator